MRPINNNMAHLEEDRQIPPCILDCRRDRNCWHATVGLHWPGSTQPYHPASPTNHHTCSASVNQSHIIKWNQSNQSKKFV